jgi:hypothetical protein
MITVYVELWDEVFLAIDCKDPKEVIRCQQIEEYQCGHPTVIDWKDISWTSPLDTPLEKKRIYATAYGINPWVFWKAHIKDTT